MNLGSGNKQSPCFVCISWLKVESNIINFTQLSSYFEQQEDSSLCPAIYVEEREGSKTRTGRKTWRQIYDEMTLEVTTLEIPRALLCLTPSPSLLNKWCLRTCRTITIPKMPFKKGTKKSDPQSLNVIPLQSCKTWQSRPLLITSSSL